MGKNGESILGLAIFPIFSPLAPPHSDNEDDLKENSLILTISLGETRTLQFKEVGESCWSESVGFCHEDCLLMSKDSQKYFKHGIPQESTSRKRFSITLRLITPRDPGQDP